MADWKGRAAPSLADIEAMAEAARARLEEPFAKAAAEVAVQVVDLAPDEILDELEIEDPYELTGLYDGVPLIEKSAFDSPDRPDVIWLFRVAILNEWIERGDVALDRLVGHVYVHELAHHLGWSDEDIAVVDRWWE
jgi:predicted Zn-dependent protease with MMP-like domain